MNIKLIGKPKIVMTNNESHHAYFAWPTIAKLQNGRICVGASGYRVEHICPFGKGVLVFSDDNGETYTGPVPVFDTVLDDRDVGLCVFGKSGLIATSFNNTLEFQRENMPQTEECFNYINSVSPEDEARDIGVSFRISDNYGETWSKIYKSPISSPHGPCVLNDGTVLWVGRIQGIQNHIEAHTIDPETGEMSFRGDLGIYNYDEIEYTKLNKIEPNAILAVQARLYRAKSLVDSCVSIALLSVALFPESPVSYYLDLIGSVIVALYLIRCGIQTILERIKK